MDLLQALPDVLVGNLLSLSAFCILQDTIKGYCAAVMCGTDLIVRSCRCVYTHDICTDVVPGCPYDMLDALQPSEPVHASRAVCFDHYVTVVLIYVVNIVFASVVNVAVATLQCARAEDMPARAPAM